MELIRKDNDLLLLNTPNFDPFVSCECGQCFRFEKISEKEYSLIACGMCINIQQLEEGWLFKNVNEKEFLEKLVPYFDLERDYASIINGFTDENLISAAEVGSGIRIFHQDPWETLISFIISQNNNIPRIKKIINSLCVLLGEKQGDIFSFPTAEAIKAAGIEGLAPIKSGFRAKYIIDAAEKVVSGEVDLNRVAAEGYEAALNELKTIKGVGDKVANCVLLFGFGYYEAFPVDVWVKRVISKYYPEDFDPKSFGEYAGIAQQYLFFRERGM